jgi:CubicO group peptidase (beta-lactamase class C family)
MKYLYIAIGCLLNLLLVGQTLPQVTPEQLGVDSHRFSYADKVILQSIEDGEIPGAVLAVVYKGKMLYLKAYGNRQVYPSVLPMETGTVFDLASVSKPIAAGISAVLLLERGMLRLNDRVRMYIPEFQGNSRIIDLLSHTSGLPSYVSIDSLTRHYGTPNADSLINYISKCRRDFEFGQGYQYSCLNFIALQRVIEIISGQNLKEFAKENIFDVLGMQNTSLQPDKETFSRIAPTERQADGTVLQGVVHDPLARIINGGISGNAGVFSDANDLAILAVALMNGGAYNGKRILSPHGVRVMTTISEPLKQYGRSLGWDVSSAHASNRGDLLGANTYGHTGYTGTSFTIDPDSELAVILLTNRVHPIDNGNVVRLRALVANVIAASIGDL